jgi:tRNA(Ile)-lysidine synthase
VIALAHQLDDQAETVLLNLLRGAGVRGASAMPVVGRLGEKILWRPLLAVPRSEVLAYARSRGLAWVEDESNADESLTRNFLRRRRAAARVALSALARSLARAARHFAGAEDKARLALREFLRERACAPPARRSSRRCSGSSPERARARRSRTTAPCCACTAERVSVDRAVGGELRLRRARGRGIDAAAAGACRLTLRPRAGGERLQIDARRPRRTLKNLFQEAGVPPWERERLPLLYCDDELVWVPGVGIAAGWQAARGARGFVPEWRETS